MAALLMEKEQISDFIFSCIMIVLKPVVSCVFLFGAYRLLADGSSDPLFARIALSLFCVLVAYCISMSTTPVVLATLDRENLYISNFIRNAAVRFANIQTVEWVGSYRMRYISVTFRESTPFGKKILFIPKSVPPDVAVRLRRLAQPD